VACQGEQTEGGKGEGRILMRDWLRTFFFTALWTRRQSPQANRRCLWSASSFLLVLVPLSRWPMPRAGVPCLSSVVSSPSSPPTARWRRKKESEEEEREERAERRAEEKRRNSGSVGVI
jgi:hypothetical protein